MNAWLVSGARRRVSRGFGGEGIEAAWLTLLHEPYGRWLLGAVALGIVAFGLYSMLCARWMRIRVI